MAQGFPKVRRRQCRSLHDRLGRRRPGTRAHHVLCRPDDPCGRANDLGGEHVHDPQRRDEEEFVLRVDPGLAPLAAKLQQHGATVVFTMLVGRSDRTTACVQMPADLAEADECRDIIADWSTPGPGVETTDLPPPDDNAR